jgi:hypothetical protein
VSPAWWVNKPISLVRDLTRFPVDREAATGYESDAEERISLSLEWWQGTCLYTAGRWGLHCRDSVQTSPSDYSAVHGGQHPIPSFQICCLDSIDLSTSLAEEEARSDLSPISLANVEYYRRKLIVSVICWGVNQKDRLDGPRGVMGGSRW